MSKAKITKSSIEQTAKVLLLGFFFLISATAAHSQQTAGRNNFSTDASLHARQSQSDDEDEDFIKPARPTVANPAEFQKAGVLQIE